MAADEVIEPNLPGVIDDAIATDEIQAGLADPRLGLTEDDLRAHAMANQARICDPAQAELNEVVFARAGAVRRSGWRPWSRANWRRSVARNDAALAAWRSKVLHDGVLPLLRTQINDRLAPLVWATVAVHNSPGLDRVRDSRFVVETVSAQRFFDLAGQIRYGAIGIAGVRGVGKSTVIEQYQTERPEPVSVLVPAPVQYNAREFVLHLYAQLCNEVLRRFAYRERVVRDVNRGTLRGMVRYLVLAVVLFGVGVLVVGPGQLLAVTHWSLVPAVVGGALLVIGLGCAGFALYLLGTVVVTSSATRRTLRWFLPGDRVPTREEFLVGQARRRLKRIRFLQTRTTGWSGKLTIPNTEIGFDRSTEQAEQPLTYPEIVHELRRFIELVAARIPDSPGVIVAIDELDKIEDAERAQQFVNEIKGVFGVSGAQFLVSVSDDALASFERRGLPVRDAFDSAFDEIVRIEPLNLKDACALLGSRVIGVSNLFSALAHCMAGGLARDIIRTARSMRAAAGQGGGIEQVCRGLVAADLQRKIHAFQQATSQLDGAPDTTDFIRALRLLHADPTTLLQIVPTLLPEDGDKADFRQVRWQAATYVYHCATVREVFTEALTTERFDQERLNLESLATAKQELGTHPQLAWLMVDEFRAAWELPTVPTA
jgi:hypothetical protein